MDPTYRRREPITLGEVIIAVESGFGDITKQLTAIAGQMRDMSDTIISMDDRVDKLESVGDKYMSFLPDMVKKHEEKIRSLEDGRLQLVTIAAAFASVISVTIPFVLKLVHVGLTP